VKKVIVALCMLEIATGFTPGGPKCLKHGEIRKRGKGKSLPPSGAKACAVPFFHCDKDFG
jgi:hypothetical protein